MGKVKVGLEYIKLGAIAGDGGMGTTLTAAGLTFLDSATLDQQEGTLTEFFAEESDDPVYSAKTKGKFILNYQIMDWDNDVLVRLAGGTKSGTGTAEVWNAPDSDPGIELSVELKFKSSAAVIRIPRAGINARLTGNVGKNNATVLSVEVTALKPTKAATASLTIGAPSATA